jgi:hypothetical protein
VIVMAEGISRIVAGPDAVVIVAVGNFSHLFVSDMYCRLSMCVAL